MQTAVIDLETASRDQGIKMKVRCCSVFLSVTLLAALGLCILAGGCRDVATTWSSEVRSPGGQWVATARTQQWGGPGTAYDATTVYLRRVKTSQAPIEILVFSHQYATMKLKVEWVTTTHLDVAYGPSAGPRDHVSLDYHVARVNGIDITVHELPTADSVSSR